MVVFSKMLLGKITYFFSREILYVIKLYGCNVHKVEYVHFYYENVVLVVVVLG